MSDRNKKFEELGRATLAAMTARPHRSALNFNRTLEIAALGLGLAIPDIHGCVKEAPEPEPEPEYELSFTRAEINHCEYYMPITPEIAARIGAGVTEAELHEIIYAGDWNSRKEWAEGEAEEGIFDVELLTLFKGSQHTNEPVTTTDEGKSDE